MHKTKLARLDDKFLRRSGGSYYVKTQHDGMKLILHTQLSTPPKTTAYVGKTIADCLADAGRDAIKNGFNLREEI